jgi:predicted esterase
VKRAALVVGIVVASGCSSVPPAEALRAYVHAKSPDEKAAALDDLDGALVPKDPVARARLLREALARPARASSARIEEQQGKPPANLIVATPEGYDPKSEYPTVIGLAAYCSNATASVEPFAKDPTGKSKPPIPWEDGLVLGPVLPDLEEFDAPTYLPVRRRMLDLIAQANRDYAVDPDRLVAVGYSLGSTVAYEMASRYPDRFAAIGDVSGGCPRHPTPLTNLARLAVHFSHGEDDDVVPVKVGHDIEAYFKKNGVPYQFELVKGGKHEWPQTPEHGQRIREFLRSKKRDAWPRKVDLVLYPEAEPRLRVYWLELASSPDKRTLSVSVEDNVITFGACAGIDKVTLFLGEPLVDLDRPVVVVANGKERFRGTVARSFQALATDFEKDGWDSVRAAPGRLEVSLAP